MEINGNISSSICLVDEKEYTVDQWKELIFSELTQYDYEQIKKCSK